MHAQAQKTRITLKMIETLTYSCQNAEQLAIANTKLQDIFDALKSATHQTEGVVIRPLITKRAKTASQRYRSQLTLLKQKYSDLPTGQKRGRHKQSYLSRKRLGRRAQLLRKAYSKKYGSTTGKHVKLQATLARPATTISASSIPQSDMPSQSTSYTPVTVPHALTNKPGSNSGQSTLGKNACTKHMLLYFTYTYVTFNVHRSEKVTM